VHEDVLITIQGDSVTGDQQLCDGALALAKKFEKEIPNLLGRPDPGMGPGFQCKRGLYRCSIMVSAGMTRHHRQLFDGCAQRLAQPAKERVNRLNMPFTGCGDPCPELPAGEVPQRLEVPPYVQSLARQVRVEKIRRPSRPAGLRSRRLAWLQSLRTHGLNDGGGHGVPLNWNRGGAAGR
jgi:hypothetical protein